LRQPDVGEVRLISARSAALHDDAGVDAEEEHQAEQDQEPDNADAASPGTASARKAHAPAAGHREPEAAAAFTAAILDIFAFSFATPPHRQATSTLLAAMPEVPVHSAWHGLAYKRKGGL
jgi:hypothetical protein